MSRKRSSFNILKDYSISSTPNQPSAEDFIITTRKRRTKVQCFCSKCNGNLVDLRTSGCDLDHMVPKGAALECRVIEITESLPFTCNTGVACDTGGGFP